MKAIEIKSNSKGRRFALCKDAARTTADMEAFGVWAECRNYDGRVHGGIRTSWRYVQRGLSREAAQALINRRAAR